MKSISLEFLSGIPYKKYQQRRKKERRDKITK